MKTSEIRKRFLDYFKKNGHTVVESSSLVPHNDPTLLFTNAGMNQFKDVFLGKDPRPYTRATTSQKCVRAGGKHNDLENVGFTARHHTFFEMLGNFSFGDYFKKDAIRFAWQFVTEELKLPKSHLYVTVFEKDDEAAEIWHTEQGVPKDRIYRFGEKDNFWSMGDTGPCGPCSEIFIDRGPEHGCKKPTCKMGCDCDRFMEFWNLVFMQFNRSADGTMTPLPKPSVDTGAGLERIASILQKVETNYDTDAFIDIIQKTAKLVGKAYDPKDLKTAVSFRVIADHSRATTFLIGDGVMPSNEGRGYVLRRIMRRAIRHGKSLGFAGPFLHKTTGFVIDQMLEAYPDLKSKRAFIERAVLAEEEQFFRTLEKGLALLDEVTLGKTTKQKVLDGETAFKLYDTFGFPLDLTRVICDERGFTVDEAGFEKAMERQRSESRKHWKGSGEQALDQTLQEVANKLKAKGVTQKFVGYEKLDSLGVCLEVIKSQDSQNSVVQAVFDVTPFYGESGGQAGDRGMVVSSDSNGSFEAQVIDVKKPVADLIVAQLKILKGELKIGETYLQKTDPLTRSLTAKNHTATHLLHWALREVLGEHVKQAGSLVNSELLRFDFSHFQPMTKEEIERVETLINQKIWSQEPVQKLEMEKDQAIAQGAIAFFGEKYGSKVRVIKVGDFSTELCGGTHVGGSTEIHLFKIASEGGIAAGVRRIIAYTSKGAMEWITGREAILGTAKERLKAGNIDEIPQKIERLEEQVKEYKRQLDRFESKNAQGLIDEMIAKAKRAGDGILICETFDPTGISPDQTVKKMREFVDSLKAKAPNSVLALGMAEPEKASLLISVNGSLQAKFKANELLKETLEFISGKGGGKPDFAQAGGSNPLGLKNAFQSIEKRVLG